MSVFKIQLLDSLKTRFLNSFWIQGIGHKSGIKPLYYTPTSFTDTSIERFLRELKMGVLCSKFSFEGLISQTTQFQSASNMLLPIYLTLIHLIQPFKKLTQFHRYFIHNCNDLVKEQSHFSIWLLFSLLIVTCTKLAQQPQ